MDHSEMKKCRSSCASQQIDVSTGHPPNQNPLNQHRSYVSGSPMAVRWYREEMALLMSDNDNPRCKEAGAKLRPSLLLIEPLSN